MGSDFPEGFQGAGPMFAAVPVAEPWYDLAVTGATTFIVEHPGGLPVGMELAESDAAWERFAGGAAFLDRAQAEGIADSRGLAEITRWDGLTEHHDVTRAEQQARAADADPYATMAAEPAQAETC